MKRLIPLFLLLSVSVLCGCSSGSHESASLRLVSSVPDNGATDVAVTTPIQLTFNAPLAATSVITANVVLEVTSTSTPVTVTLGLSNSDTTIDVTPQQALNPVVSGNALDFNTSYTVKATNIVAQNGLKLKGTAAVEFTTVEFQNAGQGGQMLYISEVSIRPSGSEFIEIYNPNSFTVKLDNFYISDGEDNPGYGSYIKHYYYIVKIDPANRHADMNFEPGGGWSADFHVRFPADATIMAGEYQTIAIPSSAGRNMTYEVLDSGNVSDMRAACLVWNGTIWKDSIDQGCSLTDSGEMVILYYWDGISDLVTDVDYVIWGSTANLDKYFVNKDGVSIDGPDSGTMLSVYAPDTASPIQDTRKLTSSTHSTGYSFQRLSVPQEVGEVTTGGNGFGGHDETSEWLTVDATPTNWTKDATATPNAAGPVTKP
jgi:hypothetical protein